jgi:AraC-like DNA-binding protein
MLSFGPSALEPPAVSAYTRPMGITSLPMCIASLRFRLVAALTLLPVAAAAEEATPAGRPTAGTGVPGTAATVIESPPLDIAARPLRFLENERLKLGVNLAIGGAVVLLADKQRGGGKSPTIRIVHLIPRHMDQATALEGEIKREMDERRPGWRDLAMGHFQHPLILISRFADKEQRISPDAMSRMAAAIRQIESCYENHLSLVEVAKSCGMSERTFYRVFRQATGETPNGYLKRLRLEHAAEMPCASDDTVTEIAYAVGFSDSNFFTREFRRIYGHSPTDYRRRWQA